MISRKLSSLLLSSAFLLSIFTEAATAQQIGTGIPEGHPRLRTQKCTKFGGCKSQQTRLVADSRHRPFHNTQGEIIECSAANKTLCPDEATCAKNCILEGLEYGSLGVLASDTAVTLRNYLFDGKEHRGVSPRVYLLAEDGEKYEPIQLLNQEISFQVDASNIGCGMNGALYLSEMDFSGGKSNLNPAGAKYGTGYCDAQCPQSDFINGVVNLNSSGACCSEMDIWEANSRATTMTSHPCNHTGPFLCNGEEECLNKGGKGVCARKGCGINPFRLGAPEFYGKGEEHKVDTSRPFTVVTRFLTDNNSTTGALGEIRRLYIQDGKTIPSTSVSNIKALNKANISPSGGKFEGALTEGYCNARDFGDHAQMDGLKTMGQALGRGMVMVFSIWNSEADSMKWLDAGQNGPCQDGEGKPAKIAQKTPDVTVTFSNIKWGDIGSTQAV
ncbi:concanavalin A-like lectin/glucanase domain-containing protein [Copromyces sp. CBS 386.78]|nr:concanavalin A-like lectin/glucanase domain-containing protein [Copromyces sp. CBS 386.78]